MAESLAEKAARARRGESVSGGTEVPSGEAGTETYWDAQARGYRQRPTLRTGGTAAGTEEKTPGLAEVLRKRKAKRAEEKAESETETKPTGGGGESGSVHAARALKTKRGTGY
jgi:hypothetical protein